MQEILNLHRQGRYSEALNALANVEFSPQSISLILDCLTKSNKTDQIPYFVMDVLFMLPSVEPAVAQEVARIIYGSNVARVSTKVQSDLKSLEEAKITLKDNMIFSNTYQMKNNSFDELLCKIKNKDVIVFPIIWPIAFGDMTVIHQYIKHTAENHKSKTIILMMPLNRPELKTLAKLNDSIDFVVDLTLLEQERDRQTSLYLKSGNTLNVSVQEKIIRVLLSKIMVSSKAYEVIKLRYFPILDGVPNVRNGFRIWENRADIWLNHRVELTKLVKEPEDLLKDHHIVVHFREANYADQARNVSNEQAQDIIDTLNAEYPDYEVVRIGDPSMTELEGCTNMLSASLEDQIEAIQHAKLFIGCHSAPQMLALACSSTPIICINYTAQETTTEMSNNIAKLSYEPVGAQVKKILYTKMFDSEGNELVPIQNNPAAVDKIPTPLEELMEAVKEVLG